MAWVSKTPSKRTGSTTTHYTPTVGKDGSVSFTPSPSPAPAPAPAPTKAAPPPEPAPTTGAVSTYTDYQGNVKIVEDYTAQGGGKYETVISGPATQPGSGFSGSGFDAQRAQVLQQAQVRAMVEKSPGLQQTTSKMVAGGQVPGYALETDRGKEYFLTPKLAGTRAAEIQKSQLAAAKARDQAMQESQRAKPRPLAVSGKPMIFAAQEKPATKITATDWWEQTPAWKKPIIGIGAGLIDFNVFSEAIQERAEKITGKKPFDPMKGWQLESAKMGDEKYFYDYVPSQKPTAKPSVEAMFKALDIEKRAQAPETKIQAVGKGALAGAMGSGTQLAALGFGIGGAVGLGTRAARAAGISQRVTGAGVKTIGLGAAAFVGTDAALKAHMGEYGKAAVGVGSFAVAVPFAGAGYRVASTAKLPTQAGKNVVKNVRNMIRDETAQVQLQHKKLTSRQKLVLEPAQIQYGAKTDITFPPLAKLDVPVKTQRPVAASKFALKMSPKYASSRYKTRLKPLARTVKPVRQQPITIKPEIVRPVQYPAVGAAAIASVYSGKLAEQKQIIKNVSSQATKQIPAQLSRQVPMQVSRQVPIQVSRQVPMQIQKQIQKQDTKQRTRQILRMRELARPRAPPTILIPKIPIPSLETKPQKPTKKKAKHFLEQKAWSIENPFVTLEDIFGSGKPRKVQRKAKNNL